MPSEMEVHEHCQACYDSKCNARLPSCDVIQCELDCGARFHACKQREHGLLCSNEKVACLNAGYGCPIKVQRSQMSRHLGGCPASLVHCTMEWNRWPVCSSERQSHQPVQVLMDFNREQLDIALAFRDQRMLTKSMRASIRTRKILTNNLNRRHPAVPLANQLTNGSSERAFDEQRELENLLQDMHQWENEIEKKRSRSPAGLLQSICDELYRASHDTAQQLSNALHVMTGNTALPERPDFSLGSTQYPYIHCAHCERRKERLERLMDSHNAMKDGGEDNQPQPQEPTPPVISQNGDTGHHGDSDDSDDNVHMVHLRDIKERLQEITRDYKDLNREAHLQNATGVTENFAHHSQDVHEHRSSSSSEDSLKDVPMPVLFVTPSTTGEVSSAPGRGHSKILVVEPPRMIPGSGVASFPARNVTSPMQTSLSLDLSLESITRYQAKPDSMYTFLCAQVFRRDEYASHFQNVHCDIHGGLNGWLEQRCPLAPYGCTYSQRRFYPGEKSARIVHNEHLESFGVRLDGNSQPTKPEECRQEDSPVEMEWVHVGMSSNDTEKTTVQSATASQHPISQSDLTISKVNQSEPDNLSQLPSELLRYLTRFLDAFSLCNLALTSKLLRQICCSILEERGMVIQQWEKQHGRWDVAYRVWHFSTAFTPVLSWGFEDYPSLAVHLGKCPFNVKLHQTDPVRVMIKLPEPVAASGESQESVAAKGSVSLGDK